MTPLFIAAAIVATPFLLWFLWRKTTPREHKRPDQSLQATTSTRADSVNTASPEAACPTDFPPLVQAQEKPDGTVTEKPEELPPALSAPSAVEADSSTQEIAESHTSEESDRTPPIADDQAASRERFSQAQSAEVPVLPATVTSPESTAPPTDIGTSGIMDQRVCETEIILPGAEIPASGDGMQAVHTDSVTEIPQSDIQSDNDELTQADAGPEREQPPQRYRPPSQRPPRQASTRPVNQAPPRAVPSELDLEIRVHLRLDRFDICEIGLSPERKPEMDKEVDVNAGGISRHLVAQEDWYEDLRFENIGDCLRHGLELKGLLADHRRARWLLTGRDIYVLANHQRASGFISTSQLVLGRSHIVLCVGELIQEVETILNEAGCRGYTKLGVTHGVPPGWIGLQEVAPTRAVPTDSGTDRFYAIKPPPDIEIELEGGICLRNSVWLAGFPPQIKLFGQIDGPVKVLIDRQEARLTANGSFAVDGYDLSGPHSVYCEGLSCSCSYSIEEPPDSWQEWPAYSFGQADICGPMVQLTPEASGRRIFSVPMSNPLLIGAEPGQLYRCSPRNVSRWKGFVPFDVVWALPATPLICDKKTARILQFSNTPVVPRRTSKKPLAWCAAILDASRKGLQIDNCSPDSTCLWKAYKRAAQNIWRAAR